MVLLKENWLKKVESVPMVQKFIDVLTANMDFYLESLDQ